LHCVLWRRVLVCLLATVLSDTTCGTAIWDFC
jgi:hypothetical protein